MSRDSELDQNLSSDFGNFFYSDLNEIWYVGRGRWVMHDGMPYGRIKGQGRGHDPWKFEFLPFSKPISSAIYNGSWQMRISMYQNVSILDFIEGNDDGGGEWWQLELKYMQISSQIVTTNKPTPNFLQARCPSCRPTNNVKALKGSVLS